MKYTITLECDNPTELFEMASRLNGGIDQSWPDPAFVEDAAAEPYVETPYENPTPEEELERVVDEALADIAEKEEVEPHDDAPSIDDVRAAMVAYTKANSRDDAIELLGQFVTAGEKAVLSNVPEENYGALVAAAS